MRFLPVQMLNAVDTSTQTGAAIDSNQAVSGSFSPVFGDTSASGTVKIQCSNDNPNGQYRQNFTPTNWNDIPNATSTIAAGVGPAIVIPNMAFGYIRAVFTYAAGGSSTVIVNATLLSI